jgi:hypothetical protein
MGIVTQAINVAIVAEMQKPQEIPAAFYSTSQHKNLCTK